MGSWREKRATLYLPISQINNTGGIAESRQRESLRGSPRWGVGRHTGVKGGEAEVEGDAPLLALWVLVEAGGGPLRGQRLGEAGLAAVHVAWGGGGGCRAGTQHGPSKNATKKTAPSNNRRGQTRFFMGLFNLTFFLHFEVFPRAHRLQKQWLMTLERP